MLNGLWVGMIMIGVLYGAFAGKLPEITEAALDSSKEAVTLCITMMGVMSFWVGIMEIAEKSGMVRGLAWKMRPLIRFLFPGLPEGHPAAKHIAANVVSNVLGLGWAATPEGLKAMEEFSKLEEERRQEPRNGKVSNKEDRAAAMPVGVANNEMCTFLVLNISSLQLIPVNIIAYRSQYGSVNPAAIVGPGIAATAVSTGVAIIYCKMMNRKRRT